jgi:hypothetical protein
MREMHAREDEAAQEPEAGPGGHPHPWKLIGRLHLNYRPAKVETRAGQKYGGSTLTHRANLPVCPRQQ